MDRVKVIVAGGRDFDDYWGLSYECRKILEFGRSGGQAESNTEIVSGKARGADRLGERFAEQYKIPIKEFPADWDNLGKSAGYIRNKEMAQYADMLIAFWDGQSKGTKHMIDLAIEHGLEVHIFRYDR